MTHVCYRVRDARNGCHDVGTRATGTRQGPGLCEGDGHPVISGDKWTIVVNIALDDYATLVDVMKTMSQVHYKIQVHKNPKSLPFNINWGEIKWLDIMVQELDNDLQRFRRFLFEVAPPTLALREGY